jgi:hypothetical protein
VISSGENISFARSRRSASPRTDARPIPMRTRRSASRRSCAKRRTRGATPLRCRSSW